MKRAKPFDPDRADGGGKNFVLFAFVNDVEEDVTEGLDGVEHMWTIIYILNISNYFPLQDVWPQAPDGNKTWQKSLWFSFW